LNFDKRIFEKPEVENFTGGTNIAECSVILGTFGNIGPLGDIYVGRYIGRYTCTDVYGDINEVVCLKMNNAQAYGMTHAA
jgi:hypothetical protein